MLTNEKRHKELILHQAREMYNNTVKTKKKYIKGTNRNLISMLMLYVFFSGILILLILFNVFIDDLLGVMVTTWLFIVLSGFYYYAFYQMGKPVDKTIEQMNIFIKQNKKLLESTKKCVEQKNT